MNLPPFNENSRVKIPALVHLGRLGYEYLSLKGAHWDPRSNIFPAVFEAAVLRINPQLRSSQIPALLDELGLSVNNPDLGRDFHRRLAVRSGIRLVDFDNPDNNSWHAVTELSFENGDDNFRPDITLLVNGLPLAIIEVKKRMNPGGVLEERDRMDRRHSNPKFRHFFNLIQLQVFSNNMEYDDGAFEPVQGAFYAASTYGKARFNYFREERAAELAGALGSLDDKTEDAVLANRQLLGNRDYFERQLMPIVVQSFRQAQPPGLDANTCRIINQLLAREYLDEAQGRLPLG